MYHAKIWDEDKLNIHASYSSSNYGNIFANNDKKEDKQYHEQKYANDKDVSSDYIKNKEQAEKEEDKKHEIFDGIEEKNPEIKDDDIKFAAARQVFQQMNAQKEIEPKKGINSIEDAIKKAIEAEKKVIIMDN